MFFPIQPEFAMSIFSKRTDGAMQRSQRLRSMELLRSDESVCLLPMDRMLSGAAICGILYLLFRVSGF